MADRHQAQAYPLRLPEEIKQRVVEAAQISGRSLNAEIVQRLADSFTGQSSDSVVVMQAREIYFLKMLVAVAHTDSVHLLAALEAQESVDTELKNLVLKHLDRSAPVVLSFEGMSGNDIRHTGAQYNALARIVFGSEVGTKQDAMAPVPPTASPEDSDAVRRRQLRQETEEYYSARRKGRVREPAEAAQQLKEPTPQTREEMRRGVDEAHAAYLAAKKDLDELPPLPEDELAAQATARPRARIRIKKGAK